MLLIALVAAAWVPSVLGWGSLLRPGGDAGLRRATTGLLGLGVVALVGILLNFALPLDPPVAALVWLAGAALAWRRRRWLLEGVSGWEATGAALALVACVLLVQPPTRLYDAGLYWLQSVRWASERRVEIGLVNLHTRLAYNNAWFVLSAALQHPLAAGKSAFFVTILPITFAAGAAARALAAVVAGERSFPTCAMAAMLLPIARATDGLGAQAPDHALAILVPYTLALWVRGLESEEELPALARAALLLSVFAVMIKVSAAPLLAGGALIALLRRRALPRRWWAGVAAGAAVALAPWLVRSVLLSGCLAFPVAATCLTGLRWTPPLSVAESEVAWIRSWARAALPPDQVVGWGWLSPWLARALAAPDVRLAVAVLAAGAAGTAAAARSVSRSLVLPLAVTLAALAFWFLSAPDPRFATGFLLALALLPAAFAVSRIPARHRGVNAVAAAAVLAGSVWLVRAMDVLDLALDRRWPVPAASWPALPETRAQLRVTSAGYRMAMPVDGDQCWNNPLVCTPYYQEIGRDWAIVPASELGPGTR